MNQSPRDNGPGSAGKYRVLAELGQGGMADVLLAVASGRSGFNKLVVLKMLRKNLAGSEESITLFLQEARLAARLNHPNVVQTYEVDMVGGRHAIIMEYLDGQPFSHVTDKLRTDRPLLLSVGLRVVIDALGGLHHAHELADYNGTPLNLVHRDASPHNMFITYEGSVKMLDFGIAKVANSAMHTQSGVMKGKIRYMAPEQMLGSDIDRRADIFAMGVILWEILTAERMWKGSSDVAVMNQVLRGSIPPPTTAAPDVPERLAAICMQALAPQRDDRFATAAEFQAALEDYVAAGGVAIANRQLGKLVSERFVEDRTRLKAAVDAQLARVASERLAESGAELHHLSGEVPFLGRPESANSDELHISGPMISSSGAPSTTLNSPVGYERVKAPPTRRLAVIAGITGTLVVIGILLSVGRARKDAPVAAAASPPPVASVAAPTDSASLSPQFPADLGAAAPSVASSTASAADPQGTSTPAAAPAVSAKRPRVAAPPPKAAPRPAAVAPAAAAAPDKAARCNPPFFIDEQGYKQPKPECL